MECDIHSFAEFKEEGKWIRNEERIFPNYGGLITEPFGWRSYGLFAFLADVRNYSHIKCIKKPVGLPNDSEYLNSIAEYNNRYTIKQEVQEDGNYHTFGHLYLKELINFNYEQIIEDRRTTAQIGPNSFTGAADTGEGNGVKQTVREFLGESYFEHIRILETLGNPEDVRIIFWFDN